MFLTIHTICIVTFFINEFILKQPTLEQYICASTLFRERGTEGEKENESYACQIYRGYMAVEWGI